MPFTSVALVPPSGDVPVISLQERGVRSVTFRGALERHSGAGFFSSRTDAGLFTLAGVGSCIYSELAAS